MNTDVSVVVVGADGDRLSRWAETAVRDREARWSRFRPDSELSRVNASPGRPVIVSADTFALVSQAIEATGLTGGAFDPTVLGSLLAAGYDRSHELLDHPAPGSDLPPVRGPSSGRPAPTPSGIELHPVAQAIVLPIGVGLDLGGIAKGATADAVSAELMGAGAEGCCVNIGGDLRVRGRSPRPAGWVVELDCPGSLTGPTVAALAEGAVCTSTVLRRTWARAGQPARTEHHLRHPATGDALDTGLWSVTVIAATATQAEVLTKAAFVAGADGAAALLADHDVTGLLVLDGGRVSVLAGFDRFQPVGVS